MSTIEDNSATPRDLSSVRVWMESSKYREYEKSRNMINVQLAREKSSLKDGCNKAPRTGENVAGAQPNVSHEEDEIQNSNFEHVPSKRPRMILKRMIGNQLPNELKRIQKMMLRV